MQSFLIFLVATSALVAAGPLPAATMPSCGSNKLLCCNGTAYLKTSPIPKVTDTAFTNDGTGAQVLGGVMENNCINYDAKNGICQKSNNLYCCDGFAGSEATFCTNPTQ
ncbi:hypothetical protein BP6252_02493 [Coleophoma cylindrospora]|uniref:Hydrophobin n=1 Tax=Coleophoma cylindrospora TaxID=1849047 RepID=A0A3D8SF34_9HELO|nr:hypothetical protein BP6252_02493 [Coleophoma cylindrospora]